MPSIAFAAPLLPGMTELDRDVMTSFQTGKRKTDYEDARHRAGITREMVWIQTTPSGDVAIDAILEADDLDAAFTALGKSDEPFDLMVPRPRTTGPRLLTGRRLPYPRTGPGLRQLTAAPRAHGDATGSGLTGSAAYRALWPMCARVRRVC